MSKLRDAIFAKGRELGYLDTEIEGVMRRVDAALDQFVGQPKTRELSRRIAQVGMAVMKEAYAELDRKRGRLN